MCSFGGDQWAETRFSPSLKMVNRARVILGMYAVERIRNALKAPKSQKLVKNRLLDFRNLWRLMGRAGKKTSQKLNEDCLGAHSFWLHRQIKHSRVRDIRFPAHHTAPVTPWK
jgi:hypothetical protein